METMPAPTVRLLLLKSGAGTGAKIANMPGFAFWGGRWHKVAHDKPAPKHAPMAHHPKSAGHFDPVAHLTQDQWDALKLPESNTNAPTFNKQLQAVKELSESGNVTALLGMSVGSNSYGGKLAKIINHLLGLHGSPHTVTPGQKPGTHSATQNAEPADPHPTGLPEHLAPKAAEPEPAPAPVAAAEAAVAPEPFSVKSAKPGHLHNEGAVHTLHGSDFSGVEKALGLSPGDLADTDSTTYTVTDHKGRTFSVYKHGGALTVRTSGKNTDNASAKELLAHLQDANGPKEGDTKPGADGAQLVFKNGRWHKYVAADESGELPPVLVPVKEPAVTGLSPEDIPAIEGYTSLGKKTIAEANAAALSGDVAGLKQIIADFSHPGDETYKPLVHAKKLLALLEAKAVSPGGSSSSPLSSAQLLANLQSIPWYKLKLPPENSNAKSHNAAIDKINAMAFSGDKEGLQAFIDGKAGAKQTYAKKQALTAQTALAALGVEGATAAVPVEPSPVATSGPAADTPIPANVKKTIDGMAKDKSALEAVVANNAHNPHVAAYAESKLAALEAAAAPQAGSDPYPLVNEWKAAIVAGKVPTKAQANAYDALSDHDPDAQMEYFIDAVSDLIPESVPQHGDEFDAAYTAATNKVNELHGHALDGTKPAAPPAAVEQGPKEGDTKQGADGMLVLKNGHWVKVAAAAPAKIKKATLDDISTAIQTITPGQTKFSTNGAGKLALAAAKKGDGNGMAAAYTKAIALDFPKTASHVKAVAQAMGVDTSGWTHVAYPAVNPAAAAPPAAPTAPVSAGGMLSMDGWAQTGGQGGSNPGGKFKDPTGQEWYCKFPKDADTAKSEILAAKLYALAGLSSQDAVLVTKGGKVGIASKWVDIKKAASPGALAKVDGAQSGFVVDAWLGNWDVVGLSYDNLQVGPDGKAHRVDAGGSLEYRAQGEKKAFGSKVEELDTLLDAGKNAQTASVFKGMTKADMAASAAKVLAISDVAIRAMVNQYGPGDAAAKAKLADTLIARKKDIAAKFPAAAKKKKAPVFKPEEISAPPSFLNWGGGGKSGPSSKEFLNKANEDAVQAIFAAAKTGNADAVKKLTAPVFDKDTGAVTGHKPALEHPSQHVKGYAQQAINEITYQLNPPKQFRFDGGHPLHSLNAAYPAHKGSPSSALAQKLGKFIVLGEPGTVSLADAGLPEKITHSEGGGTLSVHTYAKQAQAAIAKMPATQKQAVKSYTGSSYHAMNGSLWDGNPTGAAKAAGEALKTLGHDIAPGTLLSRKISLHGADLQQLLGSTGKILQEPAIMSTSIRPSSWSGNVQLKLHVGPGVKGLWVGHHSVPGGGALSSHSGEDEMILPPGTRLMIVGVKTGSDKDGFGKSSGHVVEAIILPTE